MAPDPPGLPARPRSPLDAWLPALKVTALLLLFLEGITLMGLGFHTFGKPFALALVHATTNPFLGLTIGLLATSIAQSSSMTTSIAVGLVASGALPVRLAIPVIMGANIGTTVTNTLVSLGNLSRKEEFRRAFAAATIHDFFNVGAVVLLLPLELATGFLEKVSGALAEALGSGSAGGPSLVSPVELILKPPARLLLEGFEGLGLSAQVAGGLCALLGLAMVLAALIWLVRTLRSLMMDRLEVFFERFVGRNWFTAMSVGLVLTVAVQSSSITTSLLVPMAGAGLLTLEGIFPVTLGANLGTTVTALLASLAAPAGLQVALVHFLFNLTGILLIYPAPPVRRLVLAGARTIANFAAEKKGWAVLYILLFFFGAPGVVFLVYELLFA